MSKDVYVCSEMLLLRPLAWFDLCCVANYGCNSSFPFPGRPLFSLLPHQQSCISVKSFYYRPVNKKPGRYQAQNYEVTGQCHIKAQTWTRSAEAQPEPPVLVHTGPLSLVPPRKQNLKTCSQRLHVSIQIKAKQKCSHLKDKCFIISIILS